MFVVVQCVYVSELVNTFSAEDELSRPESSFVGAEDELTRPKVWVNLESFFSVFWPNFL